MGEAKKFASAVAPREQHGGALRDAWFVHGMLENERCWAPLCSELESARAMVGCFPWAAQDQRYWGAHDSLHWLGQFDQGGPAPQLIVAHSYGCNAVLEYLLAHPERQPDCLVLISPFFREHKDAVTWPVLMQLIEGLDELIVESIALSDPQRRYSGELLAAMVARLKDRLGVYGWVEFLKLFLRAPDLPLARLRSRTLLVSGRDDRYCPAASVLQMATRLPHAESLLLEGCGHFSQLTHTRILAEQIGRFVENALSITHDQELSI